MHLDQDGQTKLITYPFPWSEEFPKLIVHFNYAHLDLCLIKRQFILDDKTFFFINLVTIFATINQKK